ncbi:hypothetical protein AVEN_266788-1 [Araneus ventricosus]|uniref:DDE-1 domain-containing protein n=1 Tax=Araneus ventricosus TaxID=182803 RepID=A0A4Y2GB43_ARAVE|nr:hypothetical protein AVEN_266788-1 [Araneus ventricosus]
MGLEVDSNDIDELAAEELIELHCVSLQEDVEESLSEENRSPAYDQFSYERIPLREFRKYHFHIVVCLKNIANTWEGVTKKILTSVWKRLWPESFVECDFERFETVFVKPVVNEIMCLDNIMGLEVDNNDIDEFVEEHSQELATKELMELHCISLQEVVEESSSEEKGSPGFCACFTCPCLPFVPLTSLVTTHFSKLLFRHIIEMTNETLGDHDATSSVIKECLSESFVNITSISLFASRRSKIRGKESPRRYSLLFGRGFGRRVLSNVTLRDLRQYL